MGRIWLIGGTSESARIAEAIALAKFPCTVTVTAQTALALYPQTPELKIQVGSINIAQIEEFCLQEEIVAVVDASHPHAAAISQGAIAAAINRSIPYLRYERPCVENPERKKNLTIQLDSFDTLLAGNYLERERALLTIGYKALPMFESWQNRCTLFARLLPALNSLEVALAAGFTSDRIIAFRPPISIELEEALWHQWQISLVVTKASGQPGGEDIKRFLAEKLGIPLIVIARPKIDYPQQTSNLLEVVEFCAQKIKRSR
jgi:precorrin-6A/cobalt-precorrin-6A reductase